MPAKDPKGRDIAFGTPAGAVFWSRTTRIVISKLFPENAEPSAEGIAISQGGGDKRARLEVGKMDRLRSCDYPL